MRSLFSFSYFIFCRYLSAYVLNLSTLLYSNSLISISSSRSIFFCISRFLINVLCLSKTPENTLFFFCDLGKTFWQGFHPVGFPVFGSTLLLNGLGPVGSGLLYIPNSLGLLHSITPLKLPMDYLGKPVSITPTAAAGIY